MAVIPDFASAHSAQIVTSGVNFVITVRNTSRDSFSSSIIMLLIIATHYYFNLGAAGVSVVII